MRQQIINDMILNVYPPGEMLTDAAISLRRDNPVNQGPVIILGENFRQLAVVLNALADEMNLPHYVIPFETVATESEE
jgi:hypothetical protein